MFTFGSAYSSKAGETKQMTEANNSIYNMSPVFGTSRWSQSGGSASVSWKQFTSPLILCSCGNYTIIL